MDSFGRERGIPRDSFTEMLALPSLRHSLVALRTKLFENLMESLKKLSEGMRSVFPVTFNFALLDNNRRYRHFLVRGATSLAKTRLSLRILFPIHEKY